MNKKLADNVSMRRPTVKSLAFLALGALFAAPASATDIPMNTVVFGNLDKVTGRVDTMSGRVDMPARFGTLEIIPRACFARPPEEPPENSAFVEIYDIPEKGDKVKVFSGWMFASSPALSALDHPVYDLWVLRCESSKASKSD